MSKQYDVDNVMLMLDKGKRKVKYTYHDNKIFILCCQIGNNFFDYDEEPLEELEVEKGLEWLLEQSCVHIIMCDDCCSCAGW